MRVRLAASLVAPLFAAPAFRVIIGAGAVLALAIVFSAARTCRVPAAVRPQAARPVSHRSGKARWSSAGGGALEEPAATVAAHAPRAWELARKLARRGGLERVASWARAPDHASATRDLAA